MPVTSAEQLQLSGQVLAGGMFNYPFRYSSQVMWSISCMPACTLIVVSFVNYQRLLLGQAYQVKYSAALNAPVLNEQQQIDSGDFLLLQGKDPFVYGIRLNKCAYYFFF